MVFVERVLGDGEMKLRSSTEETGTQSQPSTVYQNREQYTLQSSYGLKYRP